MSNLVSARSRSSSFNGLNELGGYNFQDWDILLSTACYVGKKREIPGLSQVYVSLNDLPSSIPTQVLYDYLLNYFSNRQLGEGSNGGESKVEVVKDSGAELGVLPMIRRFGSNNPNFDLDWSHSSMWSWG